MKLYRITFGTREDGEQTYAYDIAANSKKDAQEIGESSWHLQSNTRMYHTAVRHLAYDEEFLFHQFTLVTVKAMYRVVCRSRQNRPWVNYSGKIDT